MVLQVVREELVHLGDLGGDAEIDGAVADLDDETADNLGVDLGPVLDSGVLLWGVMACARGDGAGADGHPTAWRDIRLCDVTYLVGDLELLALADVGGLGDGGLEAVEGLAVELLLAVSVGFDMAFWGGCQHGQPERRRRPRKWDVKGKTRE